MTNDNMKSESGQRAYFWQPFMILEEEDKRCRGLTLNMRSSAASYTSVRVGEIPRDLERLCDLGEHLDRK